MDWWQLEKDTKAWMLSGGWKFIGQNPNVDEDEYEDLVFEHPTKSALVGMDMAMGMYMAIAHRQYVEDRFAPYPTKGD